MKNFRPRLGMGWFGMDNNCKLLAEQIFVPEWGWVGSMPLWQFGVITQHFRPRVGMGWFRILKVKKIRLKIFVPEWGWVGSLIFNKGD